MVEERSFSDKLDYFFNKVIPKKFLVIGFATTFVFLGKLDGDMWAYLAMIYMGTNGLQHIGLDISKIAQARK